LLVADFGLKQGAEFLAIWPSELGREMGVHQDGLILAREIVVEPLQKRFPAGGVFPLGAVVAWLAFGCAPIGFLSWNCHDEILLVNLGL
jgi:hypothetical protein